MNRTGVLSPSRVGGLRRQPYDKLFLTAYLPPLLSGSSALATASSVLAPNKLRQAFCCAAVVQEIAGTCSNAVLPSSSSCLGLAPFSNSSLHTSGAPDDAAKCNGVIPSSSSALTHALCS